MLLFAIGAYVLVQIGIAAWAARRTSSDDDYLVAGRRLGVFAVGMSLFATWFGSEAVIASSAAVADEGIAGARIDPFAYGLGLAALGLFVAAALRRAGHVSLAGFIGSRFGRGAETIAAVLIALSAIIWASAQLHALGAVIADASGAPVLVALVAAAAVAILYTLLGGILGDVVTDMVQGVILILGVVVVFALLLAAAGGLGAGLAAVPAERWTFLPQGESWLDQIEIWIVPILGTIAAQEAISRTLAAKSPQVARQGALLGAGIYLLVGGIPVILGLIGPTLGLSLGSGDAYLPSLARELLPNWLYVVFAGALLSAILSTVDSTFLAVSAVATESGYRRLRPQAEATERLRAARVAALLAGLAAFAIALTGEGVRALVLTASSVGAGVLIPMLFGIAGRFGGASAAVVGMTTHLVLLAVLEWGAVSMLLTPLAVWLDVENASALSAPLIPGAFMVAFLGGVVAYVAVAALSGRPRRLA